MRKLEGMAQAQFGKNKLVGYCVFCKMPIYFNEDEDGYIFTGRRHCDCVRWEDGEDDSDSRFEVWE